MKRTAAFFLCLCLIAALPAGCARTAGREEAPPPEAEGTVPETQEPAPEGRVTEVEFKAKVIRTDGYHDGETYPKSVWITSAGELGEYIEANKDYYWLESTGDAGFRAAVSEYDDAFFAGHDLLFILLEEGSGSVRHEVTQVTAVPSADGKTVVRTEIDRLVPDVGTDDMAEWHVIIEIEKKIGKNASEEVTPVLTEKRASGLPESPCRSETGGDTASVAGPYGQISVYIPDTWTAEAAPVDSGKLMSGLYGLILRPADAPADHMELYWTDSFGVCGTGLSEEKRTIAGTEATVGTFDGGAHWDFIVFREEEFQVVAQHTGGYSWTNAIWEEAMAILDTLRFDTGVTEGGAGRFIPESEDDEIGVIMEVSHVTAGGLTVTFRQYDERGTGELVFGEGYLLTKQEGDEWTEVPMIIEDGAFNDIGYIIPPQGEAELKTDWEWLYGKLVPGTYRITKTVWSTSGEGPASAYPLTAQFILAG